MSKGNVRPSQEFETPIRFLANPVGPHFQVSGSSSGSEIDLIGRTL